MNQSKPCSTCKVAKPLSAFRKNKDTKDGLTYVCRDCLNAQYKEYRKRVPRIPTDEYLQKQRDRDNAKKQLDPFAYAQKKSAYYQKNKAKYREQHKLWLQNKPGYNASKVKAYNLRKSGTKVFEISASTIVAMRKKSCFYCGKQNAGTIDHVIPLSRGGTHSIGNLVPACHSCNSRKNNRFLIVWRIQKGEFKKYAQRKGNK